MQPSNLYLLYLQVWCKAPPVPRVDLSGKTVVVIGASGGLGLEAAKHFASMNPGKLILACRNKDRGDAAVARIVRETEFKSVELWLLDLTEFSSVNAFAERFEKEESRLDILVENAAIIPAEGQQLTKDGWEPAFQTNNLAMSLLAFLLLPKMLETAEKHRTIPRLVVVASAAHYLTKLEDRVTQSPNPFQIFGAEDYFDTSSPDAQNKRYFDTKLLSVFFARALAARLSNKSIIVNSVDPGYCISDIRKGSKGFRATFNDLLDKLIALTTEEGSRQLIWASVARTPGDEEISLNGQYIAYNSVWEPSDYVVSEEGRKVQEKLWYELIKELEKINPKVRQIVDQHLTQ